MVDLEALFPGLRGKPYRKTSPADDRYNCIAWAAGITDIWWWPVGEASRTYWPASAPREETVAAIQAAFASLGFALCQSDAWETGSAKVALFADADGLPTHAARQLSGGLWTSKLGKLEDIEHDLYDLEGAEYGKVVHVMTRREPTPSNTGEQV